tara:strand:+ start:1263 stop:1829 length:567 start_codon:yes stop_codon:yes gene_type:complete
MKGISVFFAASILFCSVAQADWRWDKDGYQSAKSPMVEQRVTSPSTCYDTGWEFSGFVTGNFPDSSLFKNGVGGGASLAYFFGHNLGVEGSYILHGSGVANQMGTVDLVYRFPLGGECCANVAPYIMGGAGFVASGSNEFLWSLGGGIDFRNEGWGCVGLFTDFSYNFVDSAILGDFALVRAGVRVPF